jgi:nicotinate phosphoribosyltransferase
LQAVFEVYARDLPAGRRYGVVAGTGRLLEALGRFCFCEAEIDWLARRGIVSSQLAEWLGGYRFSGSIDGYEEGEVYVPGSPVLTVAGTLAEAMLLETLLLSVLNFDSAVATTASRMGVAAGGRPLIEMGGRRTHEEAAVAAARAAYVAGFASTSNLEAGFRHGVPTAGTAAHALTLAHRDEEEAFGAQVATLGTATTLLVDTYDVERGIGTAVEVAGTGLGAIRIDSGDLAAEAKAARRELDELGALDTSIVLSGDLDEHRIARIVATGAPADAFGIGTRLVSGAGSPPPGFVYKLVAIAEEPGDGAPLRPVAKRGGAKATVGGRKHAARAVDAGGIAVAEVVSTGETTGATLQAAGRGGRTATLRPLQVPLVRSGVAVSGCGLEQARARHRASIAELPPIGLDLSPGDPCLPTVVGAEGVP